MTQAGQNLTITVVSSLADVAAAPWDALDPSCQPFSQHRFLHGLEASQSVGGAETGWIPQHLLAWRDGRLVGALPLYAKLHPFGEYVFDGAWSDAAVRAGVSYYPKLVSAVPFTPVTGMRLRLPAQDREQVYGALIAASWRLAEHIGAGGVHVLFCSEAEARLWASAGFVVRHDIQFHWHRRPEWHDFEDMLTALRSPARKQIRQERRRAADHGLILQMVEGPKLTDDDWHALRVFYLATAEKKGGYPYLTADFFAYMRSNLCGAIVASLARRPGDVGPVAGALFVRHKDRLWGRYWGALRDYDALHFELCYHLPVAWGLAHGINHIEAGAQGLHKHKRGFMPVRCTSTHRLRHPGLHDAVAASLQDERENVAADLRMLQAHSPFSRQPAIIHPPN